ncbi:MAG: phosphoribulokinase [Gammaproteobacteria bacterium]|nr:phosphoribulokinase [Gammaproteobacteria bacterium]
MSAKHPVVVVTGSSGAGTTTVKNAFQHMFHREGINAAVIEGDAFHRYDRMAMKAKVAEAAKGGKDLSHFGPEANILDKLELLFKTYGESGTGQMRKYLHDEVEAAPYKQDPGTFTPWEAVPEGSDILFYEGLHGGVVTEEIDLAKYVDLLVGVVPIVNLEWIQKIHRDTAQRGYSAEAVTDTILRRMPDYVNTITPQFSRTDINFQRVPVVDTSNPFISRDIPTPDESLIVIRFRHPEKHDLPYYLSMLKDSWMSRPNTIVLPGGKMGLAMEIILNPVVHDMMEKKRSA